jgi:hypothetical protein
MKKIVIGFALLVIVGSFVISDANAGQICWQLDPFIDIVKVTLTKPDPNLNYKLLNGVWRAGTLLWPVVGSMVKSSDGTQWIISLIGTRNDNTLWALRGEVDKVTKNGIWSIKNPEDAFANNGTFTKIPCSTLFPTLTPDEITFSATDVTD